MPTPRPCRELPWMCCRPPLLAAGSGDFTMWGAAAAEVTVRGTEDLFLLLGRSFSVFSHQVEDTALSLCHSQRELFLHGLLMAFHFPRLPEKDCHLCLLYSHAMPGIQHSSWHIVGA